MFPIRIDVIIVTEHITWVPFSLPFIYWRSLTMNAAFFVECFIPFGWKQNRCTFAVNGEEKTPTGFNLLHEIPIETLAHFILLFDGRRVKNRFPSVQTSVHLLTSHSVHSLCASFFIIPCFLGSPIVLCHSTCAIALRKPVTLVIFFNEHTHTEIKGKRTWTAHSGFDEYLLTLFWILLACFPFNRLLAVAHTHACVVSSNSIIWS